MERAFGLEIPENLAEACELNRTALASKLVLRR
jgi:hypothetical protein